MKELSSLEDVLVHEMQDIYDAENQLIKALPKMAKAASNSELKSAFEQHLEQTKGHVDRLEQAFEMLGQDAKGHKCKGMSGLIDEGKEVLKGEGEDSSIDALLIAAAQKVEHYEIAAYGSICTFAKQIQQDDLADLLHQTLDEEKETDQKLTEIAESNVNVDASVNADVEESKLSE
jgi:ferritin-like metal-binding protein YciE